MDGIRVSRTEEKGEEESDLWGVLGGGEVGDGEPGKEEKGEGKQEAEQGYGEDMEGPSER